MITMRINPFVWSSKDHSMSVNINEWHPVHSDYVMFHEPHWVPFNQEHFGGVLRLYRDGVPRSETAPVIEEPAPQKPTRTTLWSTIKGWFG